MSFPRSVLAAAGRLTPARRDRDRPGLGSRRLVCIYDYIYIYINVYCKYDIEYTINQYDNYTIVE